MATEKEIDGIYMSNYLKVLDLLQYKTFPNKEAYEAMADCVRIYREWVALVAGLKDLPEVPAK